MSVVDNLFNKLFDVLGVNKVSSSKSIESTAKNSNNLSMNNSIMAEIESKDGAEVETKGSYSDLVSAMNELQEEKRVIAKANKAISAAEPATTDKKTTDTVVDDKKASAAASADKKASAAASADKKASAENKSYVIKAGDTFQKIAKAHGVSTKAIVDANPGVNPGALRVGQKVNLPGAAASSNITKMGTVITGKPAVVGTKTTHNFSQSTHTVKSGDTWWALGQQYGVSVSALKKVNENVTLKPGATIKIPGEAVYCDMPVDESKRAEYKAAIVDMMKAKKLTDPEQVDILSNTIIDKAIKFNLDPILVAGIIGQEVDFRFMSDNIWGRNGKGAMQLTTVAVYDLYRCKPGVADEYLPCREEIKDLMKKYPTKESLFNALCKKENYELNIEVGILVFKSKLQNDYLKRPNKTDEDHIANSVRNYNGNVDKKASGIEVREDYKIKIMANYKNHKVS